MAVLSGAIVAKPAIREQITRQSPKHDVVVTEPAVENSQAAQDSVVEEPKSESHGDTPSVRKDESEDEKQDRHSVSVGADDQKERSKSLLESLHSSMAAASLHTDGQAWRPDPPPPPLIDDFDNDDEDDWMA